MRKQSVAVLAVLALGLSVLLLADVKTDYKHSFDFAKIHTYSWIKVQASDQLWQDRIMHDVDEVLEEKGWQKVPANGDAGITAFGVTKNVPTMETFYDGLGGGWGWRGFGGDGLATTTVENNREGTLTVDIFSSVDKQLIWRGMATNTLAGSAEKNEKKLRSAVDDLFKHFPPKPKG